MKNTLKNNPKDLIFLKDLVIDSYSNNWLIDKFIVFKSFNRILYLIYSDNNKSIISYNIIDNKKINEVKNAHKDYISSFRYYLDNTNKRDLVISLSSNLHYSNIKLWDINNLELILNIEKLTNYGFLKSACFLNDNKGSYIVVCFVIYHKNNPEAIKVYDFDGNKTKEINDSEDNSYYIDNYYDDDLNKNFILTGNLGYIKSYDYNGNKIYHKYYEYSENICGHLSIIINKKKEITELIESCCDGNIRIWNFHTGKLLKKIRVSNNYSINGLCLWNNKYLFVGCYDKEIKLIELSNGNIIKHLISYEKRVLTIKKIYHIKYGYCLISQGYDKKIKLWINKK